MFDRCGDFNEGLAVVGRDYKYGFIDGCGDEIIPLMYDYVYDFFDGYANLLKCASMINGDT